MDSLGQPRVRSQSRRSHNKTTSPHWVPPDSPSPEVVLPPGPMCEERRSRGFLRRAVTGRSRSLPQPPRIAAAQQAEGRQSPARCERPPSDVVIHRQNLAKPSTESTATSSAVESDVAAVSQSGLR